MDDVLDGMTEGVLVADADWRITRANAVVEDLLERERDTLIGADIRDVFPRSAASTFHEHFGGDTPERAAISFEEYFPELAVWLRVRTTVMGESLAVYHRDITDRKELEREREDREAELARLDRINDIIQQIIRDLVGATTREEVERMVCERLAATDLYEFTWIGDREMTGDQVAPRTAAGEYDGILDLVIEGGADAATGPEYTAMQTGETRIVRHLVDDESVPEPVRREAFARGLQSSIAVPLRYGDTTYGVVGVYATRPDAFSEREQESLETLGVATGFVINATRQRNLLLSDTVIELSFRLTDPDVFFVAASAQLDCTLVVEGIVPLDEASLLCYVRIEGADPDPLLEMVEPRDGVDAGRVVHTATDEGGFVEITVSASSAALVLVTHAAPIRTAEFDRGTGLIVAELAPSGDVREVVEALGEAFPQSELLSKREHERPVETAQEFRSTLHERLTDRQRNALQTAYHGGYFESPRDSTAEELAETLGISSPTLHYHLRAGQKKLLNAFFDENTEYKRPAAIDDQQPRQNR
ncbi:bacterio-opsin activator domain-containing protein [Natrinema sp. 1APR25-10V2]|uniref:bacterio-opsin activator domain-containing protein n=1 Tax=Natrinema sp. 1APR25-10V2 TaxID=2951081 RepID=UPI002875AD70|nr:bacterio-opsin activator domain-containing protein [Natrinema sp. 1APR25-10V2]MDS0473429.1 helix-turn-helix domain-containing protein [Natrinema sp. 1APR25-10V2]